MSRGVRLGLAHCFFGNSTVRFVSLTPAQKV